MSVKEELTKSMTTFGFSIIQSLVTDIRWGHCEANMQRWCPLEMVLGIFVALPSGGQIIMRF